MTIADLVHVLEGEVVCCGDKLHREVHDFAASDLLSDVLAVEKENYALLTGLTNSQIVRTAEITNAACIVVVRDKRPQQAAATLAERAGVPLILTRFNMFDSCVRISRLLEQKDGGASRSTNPPGT